MLDAGLAIGEGGRPPPGAVLTRVLSILMPASMLALSLGCALEQATISDTFDPPGLGDDTDAAPETDATADSDGLGDSADTADTGTDDTDDTDPVARLDPCEADATNAVAASVDVLYDSRTSLDWPTGAWETLGTDTLVITDATAWLAFEAAWGLNLRDPDLYAQQVVAVFSTATSTCGLSLTSAAAWDLGDGRLALDVDFDDSSLGCDEVCDATGFALWVAAVSNQLQPTTCVDVTGGCTDTDADTDLP